MSAGLPSGAPASTHRDDGVDLLVAQRAVVGEVLDADRLVDVPRRHLPAHDARFDRTGPWTRSSYVTSDIGAIESARWQAWHLSWRIGATSLAKVTGSPAAHASDEQAVKRVTTRASRTADGRRADIVRSRFRVIADAGRIIRLRIGDRGSGIGDRGSGIGDRGSGFGVRDSGVARITRSLEAP